MNLISAEAQGRLVQNLAPSAWIQGQTCLVSPIQAVGGGVMVWGSITTLMPQSIWVVLLSMCLSLLSQRIWNQYYAFGCGGTGDFQHGSAAERSAGIVWCNQVNMEQNPKEMFPTSCEMHEKCILFWQQKEVHISIVFLIKCSESVCVYLYMYHTHSGAFSFIFIIQLNIN